jgi:hypothetical protein
MDAYGPQNSPPETSLAPESSFLIQSLRSIMTTGALCTRTACLKARLKSEAFRASQARYSY